MLAEELLTAVETVRGIQRNADLNRLCPKKRYSTEEHALQALAEIWSARGYRRCEQRAYKCDRCSYWHLTKRPEREDRETA